MTQTKQAEVKELEAVKAKAEDMQKMLDQFQVTNDEELGIVSDKIKHVKTLQKFIEEKKEKFVAPAKAIIAEAKETYDIYIKKCQNAEIVLKERAKKYMVEKEQKRKAEEDRIAARVEKGTLKPETAVRKMEELPEAQKTVRTDTGSGLRLSKRRTAKIVDPGKVPDEFWIIDEVRVKREALERDKYGKDPIPGVEVSEESILGSV